ncbi:MAG: metallophosphoesterase, partial [Chloroflexi bacterium]|nr:metallophosphoesterase [Chloroflexota bacterium]
PFTILLYHSPDLAPQAAALGTIDLQLAGHTHGGQVRLPFYGALLTSSLYGKQLEMGLYQLRDMLLYVSRGVGLEGMGAPRARFRCRPEVTLITLRGQP